MKIYLFRLCFVILYAGSSVAVLAQPVIEWTRPLTGAANAMVPTSDGGYFLGGSAKVERNVGGQLNTSDDYWINKVSADGTTEWERTLGGFNDESIQSVQQTADGGFIVCGRSKSSIGGDKSEDNRGELEYGIITGDLWVVKLSASGVIEWDRTLGGGREEYSVGVEQTAGGDFYVAATSHSNSSVDKSENRRGAWDYWIVKINASGDKLWDKTVGGNGDETLRTIKQTSDGSIILAGTLLMSDDSGYPNWFVKVSPSGNIIWEKFLYGLHGRVVALNSTSDGGYIMGGEILEDETGTDYWVVKLSSDFSVEWQTSKSGISQVDNAGGVSGFDGLVNVVQSPSGGYLIGGVSSSGAGLDKSENNTGDKFESDFWFVRLDSIGNKIWDKNIGGEGADFMTAMLATTDGGYLFYGYSFPMAGLGLVKLTSEISLPVKLASFTVQKESTTTNLTWQTTSETRSDHFDVEYSVNAKAWNTIATVNAAGESYGLQSYWFVHSNPQKGNNYYRLKMVDTDGTYACSSIEQVKFEFDFEVSVYPNPAAEAIHLKTGDWSKVKGVQILNSQGKTLYNAGNRPSQDINARSLRPGLYFIKLTLADGTETTRKIAIEH